MGLNDTAWEQLFGKYHILNEIERTGSFIISSNQIKEFREPRLMTKFDHRVNLPQIFAENQLAILPITRGDYIISRFLAYHDFTPPTNAAQFVRIPTYLQSLAPQYLVSEAIALNCANACGILSDFLEDDDLRPTVSGRMSSGEFNFHIKAGAIEQTVAVNNAQIEIDAAYEGVNYLSVFEAKRDIADDFLVRQIYYPFRVWSDRITKTVKPVFLIFSNGTFYLYQYEFSDPLCYNSLQLVKQKNYVLSSEITLTNIEELLRNTALRPEPEIAFPQANNMARVVNLIELLAERPLTKPEITAEYAFDVRQTDYYADAGCYLGFVERMRIREDGEFATLFSLTPSGHAIMKLGLRERQLAIAKAVLEHRVFNETLKAHLHCGEMPDAATIVQIMRKSNLYRVEAESTFYRRSSTVIGWVNWILGLIEGD